MSRFVFWDFDGTLATAHGWWSTCLLRVLDAEDPGHSIDIDQLRPFLQNGFPWHDHETEHLHLCEPDAWWGEFGRIMARAFAGVGYGEEQAAALAAGFRSHFCDPSQWQVFDDVVPALEMLKGHGWRHLILSNHIPELQDIVSALSIAEHIDTVVTSARIGYDKPHAGAYRAALEAAGDPDEVWMVGDNPVADVAGAERMGIPAILIRPHEMTEQYEEQITQSYGGKTFLDWKTLLKRQANDAIEAADIIATGGVIVGS